MMRAGTDCVVPIPRERFDMERYYDGVGERPGTSCTRSAALIDDIDRFDARFFTVSPREADGIDPQQRLLLECCWEALERANIAPSSLFESDTGVFVGCCSHDYEHITDQAHMMAVRARAPSFCWMCICRTFSVRWVADTTMKRP